MSIKKAQQSDLETVKTIVSATISEVYPHYYPKGAVDYFLVHHCEANIAEDLHKGRVYLCVDAEEHIVGTVTIKDSEICRLFVSPAHQGHGYGTEMLDHAEGVIARQYSEITLAASLPAKKLYQRRGYREVDYQAISTENQDFLCYDVMKKQLESPTQRRTQHESEDHILLHGVRQ